MKNLEEILKKLNENNLAFALDDFDDEELQSQINSKVKNDSNIINYLKAELFKKIVNKLDKSAFYIKLLSAQQDITINDLSNFNISDDDKKIIVSYLKEYIFYGVNTDVVDMLLPSGTQWGAYNLGANSIDEYGKIYELDLNKDIAYEETKIFKIPTLDQFNELFENTDHIKVKNGFVFASKENPLHFIFFNENDDCNVYMVSGIYENNTFLGMKLFKFSDFYCKPMSFRLLKDLYHNPMSFKLLNDKIPKVQMKIRPVYNENEIQI